MKPALRILHHLPLSSRNWGGIQVQFAEFLAATAHDPRLRNFLSADMRALPRQFEDMRPHLADREFDYRTWRGLTLPKPWRGLREASYARSRGVDIVLNTNLLGDMRSAVTAERSGAAAVYWERGAAWFPRSKALPRDFAGRHRLFMGNSVASRQMLREVWAIDRPVEVCSPCVWRAWPAAGLDPAVRRLPADRPLRLGMAARLRAFKGGVLAVHTLAELRRRGVDAQLLVAGDGPDRAAMEAQARRLGIAGHVSCLGHVDDMDRLFYGRIDLLLHPALREPYGNVCAEAAFAGVPSVATRVDGLPEVVAQGRSGLCVRPDLPLGDLTALGGDVGDVYPVVYKPDEGRVGTPELPNPAALADAVMAVTQSPRRYEAFSRGALETARDRSSVARHLDRFVELLHRALA